MNSPSKRIIQSLSKGIPDELYLKLLYKRTLGRELKLNPPESFNEKIQWLKLHDRKPLYTQIVDKYEAKKYVANIIGGDYIIPTFGVWKKFDDVDFDSLPNEFVLKCTHDSGGLVICRDKERLNIEEARRKINRSLARNYYWYGREWPYKNVEPRIIAEQYMQDDDSKANSLIDYKFYCFNGNPEFLYISKGLENHKTARISFVTLDWQFANYKRKDYQGFDVLPKKPKNFDKMIKVCKQLSQGFPFLRVDLYEINGRIYFSELTLSPCTGMMPFEHIEDDYKIGELLNIQPLIQ